MQWLNLGCVEFYGTLLQLADFWILAYASINAHTDSVPSVEEERSPVLNAKVKKNEVVNIPYHGRRSVGLLA